MTTPKPDRIYYDYYRQAWVKDGLYERCGHPEGMNCQCWGRLHQGDQAAPQSTQGPIASDGSIVTHPDFQD